MEQFRMIREVRRAHLSVAALIPEVTAHELFDDMLHRDIDAEQANSMVSSAFAHELFGEMPLADVIWDEELLQSIDSQDGLLHQLAHGTDGQMDCKKVYPVLSESGGQVVYDKMLDKVVWDEEMSTKLDTNSKLLQLLASGGGYLDDEKVEPAVELDDNKVIGNLLSQENSSSFIVDAGRNVADSMFVGMALEDATAAAHDEPDLLRDSMERKHDACELLREMPSEIMWDEIPSGSQTHGNVLQLVMGVEDLQQLVMWDDDMPLNLDLRNSHLEQCTSVKQEQGDHILTNVVDLPLFLQFGTASANDIFDKIPDGQGLNDSSENSVMSEQKQEVTDRQLVPVESQSWRRSDFNPRRCGIEAGCLFIGEMQSDRCGFSPGGGEQQIELYRSSTGQWNPGVFNLQVTCSGVNSKLAPLMLRCNSCAFSSSVNQVMVHQRFSSLVIGKLLEADVPEWLIGWECSSNATAISANFFKCKSELLCLVLWHGTLADSILISDELNGPSLGEINELQSKIDPSVRMQWDPGIMRWIRCECKGCNTATAWGQAVFRGGGNVMTQIYPREAQGCEAHLPSHSPKEFPSPRLHNRAMSTRVRHRREINQKRTEQEVVFLLRSSEILSPSRSPPVICSRPRS